MARLWVGRPCNRLLRVLFQLRNFLNPRLQFIQVFLDPAPVLTSPVVLLRGRLRAVVPRGRAIGILVAPNPGTGSVAAGTNKYVNVCQNRTFSLFRKKVCECVNKKWRFFGRRFAITPSFFSTSAQPHHVDTFSTAHCA